MASIRTESLGPRSLAYKPGRTYGILRVIGYLEQPGHHNGKYRVECLRCGNVVDVWAPRLWTAKTGRKKRCSRYCLQNKTHPLYSVWQGMKKRCNNSSASGYDNYGGRGISVCKRWQDSFTSFVKDMGSRPTAEHSIERVDNEGNYEPSNCVWATSEVQARNKRNNRHITIGGASLVMSDWARICGVSRQRIHQRIKQHGTYRAIMAYPEASKLVAKTTPNG